MVVDGEWPDSEAAGLQQLRDLELWRQDLKTVSWFMVRYERDPRWQATSHVEAGTDAGRPACAGSWREWRPAR